ncbi:MAG: hypothetical protein IH866_05305 [Chloroflexi bacterium]|nr:hypothetical protein [Chloroflexota bacterium]
MKMMLDTTLYSREVYVLKLNHAVQQAAKSQRPYAILACVPQGLPGEITADVVSVVDECVLGLVREQDMSGIMGRDIVVLGLAETGSAGAQATAHRLQNELTLRSTPLRNTVWESGFACLPEDGLTAGELLDAAIRSARSRRRRLAH